MSVKAERGTKRTCQNAQCGAASTISTAIRRPARSARPFTNSPSRPRPSRLFSAPPKTIDPRKVKKPIFPEDKVNETPEAEGEEALVALEDEEAAAGGEDDETFLEEEEEDGADMSNIIGGPVAEGEEPV